MAFPGWVAPALGALDGLFGGHSSGASPNLERLYKQFNTILDTSLNIYKTASGTGPDSLKSTDARALAQYRQAVLDQTQAALGSYDARAAAAGSPLGQADTAKDRARTQIASGMASDVAGKEYAQSESLLAREAALLPSTSSAATGFGAGGAIDAANSNQNSALLNSVLNLASSIPGNQGHTPANPFAGYMGMDPYNETQGPGGWINT